MIDPIVIDADTLFLVIVFGATAGTAAGISVVASLLLIDCL